MTPPRADDTSPACAHRFTHCDNCGEPLEADHSPETRAALQQLFEMVNHALDARDALLISKTSATMLRAQAALEATTMNQHDQHALARYCERLEQTLNQLVRNLLDIPEAAPQEALGQVARVVGACAAAVGNLKAQAAPAAASWEDDAAFMVWLEANVEDWKLEFSGHLEGLWAAFKAGQEQP